MYSRIIVACVRVCDEKGLIIYSVVLLEQRILFRRSFEPFKAFHASFGFTPVISTCYAIILR